MFLQIYCVHICRFCRSIGGTYTVFVDLLVAHTRFCSPWFQPSERIECNVRSEPVINLLTAEHDYCRF